MDSLLVELQIKLPALVKFLSPKHKILIKCPGVARGVVVLRTGCYITPTALLRFSGGGGGGASYDNFLILFFIYYQMIYQSIIFY